MSKSLGRWDVHHHIFPPFYMKNLSQEVLRLPTRPWSPENSLQLMDVNGIGYALSSVSTSVDMPEAFKSAKLARECNDYAAKLRQKYPDHFGILATLPMPYVPETLREIDYALDALRVDGFALMTNYRNQYLGNPKFEPVMAALNERKSKVFVHPAVCTCVHCHPLVPDSALEFPFDTTRTMTSLLFSRVFEKFKDISFIFCHGGGVMPYLLFRLEQSVIGMARAGITDLPDVRGSLSRQYYDLTTAITKPVVTMLRDVTSIDHLIFGTDYPFVPDWRIAKSVVLLQHLGLSEDEMARLERTNLIDLLER